MGVLLVECLDKIELSTLQRKGTRTDWAAKDDDAEFRILQFLQKVALQQMFSAYQML